MRNCAYEHFISDMRRAVCPIDMRALDTENDQRLAVILEFKGLLAWGPDRRMYLCLPPKEQ